jgi:hypothetical protein
MAVLPGYSTKVNQQLGNRYKAAHVSIPDGSIDYSICENFPSLFPDWNSDWIERDYWDICVIKNLDGEIAIKFHSPDYNSLALLPEDSPSIFEHLLYRDVFITNLSGAEVNFNILFVNNRTIDPPPFKPVNSTAKAINATTIKVTFDDITATNDPSDEDFFKVERSSTGPLTGFVQVGVCPKPALYGMVPPITLTYTDTSCIGTTQYWYRIRAYSTRGGNSPYTSVVTATTL